MKNSEIIQFIDRFCAHNEELDTISNADLAYTILAHGYLYVMPGKSTEKFVLRVVEALKVGATDGFDNYLEDKWSTRPLEEWVHISMANAALQVAKKAFNKRYFKKQVARLDPDEMCDETLLDKYLNLMSKEQLLDFMSFISYHRALHLAFTTFNHEIKITDELHELCYKINPSIPETTCGLEYLTFREKHPYYMADYLNKDEIVNAIKREIVLNKGLAGHVARMFYSTNETFHMEPYIELIRSYEYVFNEDIYKPCIFYETLYLL